MASLENMPSDEDIINSDEDDISEELSEEIQPVEQKKYKFVIVMNLGTKINDIYLPKDKEPKDLNETIEIVQRNFIKDHKEAFGTSNQDVYILECEVVGTKTRITIFHEYTYYNKLSNHFNVPVIILLTLLFSYTIAIFIYFGLKNYKATQIEQ